jgi:hypothetical protein
VLTAGVAGTFAWTERKGMSNSHLALILAILLVSVMVNRNSTAHEPGYTDDQVVCCDGYFSKTLIDNEE